MCSYLFSFLDRFRGERETRGLPTPERPCLIPCGSFPLAPTLVRLTWIYIMWCSKIHVYRQVQGPREAMKKESGSSEAGEHVVKIGHRYYDL